MAALLLVDQRLELAGELVVRTRIFYDLWWFYENIETRPQILDAMNHYPEFFRYDSHAHFVAFVVHIAALFEKRNDTINLPALKSELEKATFLDSAAIAKAESILNEIKPLAPKVMILRSNLFAHRSASLSYAEAFKLADVTANQLGHLSDLSLRLANCLLIARSLKDRIFHMISRAHLKALLDEIGK